MVGTVLVLLVFGVARLLRPRSRAPRRPPTWSWPGAALVTHSPESSAHLALVGDKALLFNDTRTAFIMYGVAGRSWVAMGDPVGPPEEATELAWRFRELATAHHGWTCFYQVGPAALPRYLDLGLALLKLGEEATRAARRLPPRRRRAPGLRHDPPPDGEGGAQLRGGAREGVLALLPELQAISDAWLAEKHTREKGFSLGFFSPALPAGGPVALVRREGSCVGFANLWAPVTRGAVRGPDALPARGSARRHGLPLHLS